jgi:hypothetical protein
MPSDPRPLTYIDFSIETIAQSRTETLLFLQLTLICLFEVTAVQTDYAILSATDDLVLVFKRN